MIEKKLNLLLHSCDKIYNLYCDLMHLSWQRAYVSIFNQANIQLNLLYNYENINNISSIGYEIKLFKKSPIEHNQWDWAKINVYNSRNVKSEIFISDSLWATISQSKVNIESCSHTSVTDILQGLEEQIKNMTELIKDIHDFKQNNVIKMEKIIASPELYFNLWLEDKTYLPVILNICESNNFLLLKFKDFIINEDFELTQKVKILEKIETMVFKKSLDKTLKPKENVKKNKI